MKRKRKNSNKEPEEAKKEEIDKNRLRKSALRSQKPTEPKKDIKEPVAIIAETP